MSLKKNFESDDSLPQMVWAMWLLDYLSCLGNVYIAWPLLGYLSVPEVGKWGQCHRKSPNVRGNPPKGPWVLLTGEEAMHAGMPGRKKTGDHSTQGTQWIANWFILLDEIKNLQLDLFSH